MPTTSSGYWFPTEVDNAQLETTFATAASSQQAVFDGINNRVGIVEGELGMRLPRYAYGTRAALDATVGVAGQVNVVTNDPNPNNNGDYVWQGSWVYVGAIAILTALAGTQTIPNATVTQVALGSKLQFGDLDLSVPNSVVVTHDGLYECSGFVRFLNAFSQSKTNYITVNGVAQTQNEFGAQAGITIASLLLTAGDVVTLQCYQASGVAQPINHASAFPTFAWLKVERKH